MSGYGTDDAEKVETRSGNMRTAARYPFANRFRLSTRDTHAAAHITM